MLNLEKAELFWVKEAQKCLIKEFEDGKFNRLSAKMREDGIIVASARIEAFMRLSYNELVLLLLPYGHRLSILYTKFIHNFGVATTLSKVRRNYWIIKLQRIAKSICYLCVICRKERKEIQEQIMGQLPIDRLKQAPAWYSISLDYLGPVEVRGEVNKRSRGKTYGLIINYKQTRTSSEIAYNALIISVKKSLNML